MEDVCLDIKSVDVSIVIPVYNGANTLVELYEKIRETFLLNNMSFQLIFVDDYSCDNSWEIIKEVKNKFPNEILAIKLSKNFGQHNATLCGLKYAVGEFVVTLDDDLEYNPKDIFLLIENQKKTGSDLVYGTSKDKKNSIIKTIFRGIYKKVARFLEGEDKMKGSSFRLLKLNLAREIVKNAKTFSFIDEFIHWHTSNISSVNVESNKINRDNTKSRYSFYKLSILTKELVFFNSLTPLRVVMLIGLIMSSCNFIWGLIILYRKFVLSISVEGYASIIVAILFSSGLIILSIGVLAEYISKIIKISYNKPPYSEAEVL